MWRTDADSDALDRHRDARADLPVGRGSQHRIQETEPEVVAAAIREVVTASGT